MIPYGHQDINEADVQSVIKVLQSDFLTQGPVVPLFEEKIADYCKTHHAIAVNSGTSALHLACLALNVGPGDWVWTSPITFVASANCALYCGASVDFVDIEPSTGNMCPDELERKLVVAEQNGKLPKAVIPVHYAGQSCDMQSISRLADQYGFKIIEDACHAIGASYMDRPVGSGKYSDITVFSFHPVKIITTAEGGMAVTRDESLAEKMRLLRSHGITREPSKMVGQPEGNWYYEQIELGFNYRMTDIQAALGLSQYDRLDHYVSVRHQIAKRYDEAFAELNAEVLQNIGSNRSAHHLYMLFVEASTRPQVFHALREKEIGVNVHYIPVHTQPFYRRFGFDHGQFPKAENFYKRAITLPIYPTLTRRDQEFVISSVKEVLS